MTSNYSQLASKYGADIVPTDSFTQSVDLVVTGRAAATLNDILSFLDFKKYQLNTKVKVAASEPANVPSGILVHKNQTALVDAINKALDEIKADGTYKTKADGTYKTISLRYFGQDISQYFSGIIQIPLWLQLMYDAFWRLFTTGLMFTLLLAVLSFVGGLVLGFLVALVRLYGPQPLKGIADYIWVIRGTPPLLVQLFLIFYDLPSAGVTLEAFPAALIGFTLSVGAYSGHRHEFYPGDAQGHFAAVGVCLHTPLANSFISLIKDTSLAAVITVPEIFLAAQRIVSMTYEPLILYIEAAAIYLLFSMVLGKGQNRLERYFRCYE